MTLYYEGDGIRLYHGDCREITAWLEADVLVTDPPYGMAYQSGQRKVKADRIEGDQDPAIRDAVLASWGSTKPAVVFGTWRVPPPRGERQRLVWAKFGTGLSGGALTVPWGNTHEEIYVLGQWDHRPGAGIKRSESVLTTDLCMGNPNGYVATIGHPTPKPVSLMERLLLPTVGGIADPFAGSGSTLVAARNLGRPAIGVELEERYCEIAARRLDQGVLEFPA